MSFEPWLEEPSRKEWVSDGFKCLIARHKDFGHLCGYVAIPEGHPWFEKSYMKIDADVHGGLTFESHGDGDEYKDGDWYRPQFDENGKKLWWIGFDCNHYYDFAPYNESVFKENAHYRNIHYVTGQTVNLAQQVKEAAIGVGIE